MQTKHFYGLQDFILKMALKITHHYRKYFPLPIFANVIFFVENDDDEYDIHI